MLTVPPDVDHPPVALLIAGSGTTDHDGNGPQVKPATLKKLSEQLVARKIATLRYDKRGAGGWKPEFGRPEDFRFKDFVDDAVSLVNYLRSSGKFSQVIVIGHSEGGLVGILTARRVPIDRLVLLVTAARKQGDLVKSQLEKTVPPDMLRADRQSDRRHHGRTDRRSAAARACDRAIDAARHRLGLQRRPDRPLEENHRADADHRRRPRPPGGAGGFRRAFRRLAVAKTLWLPDMNHVLVDVTDEADDLKAYNDAERPLDPATDRRAWRILFWRNASTASSRQGRARPGSPANCVVPTTRAGWTVVRPATTPRPSTAAALRLTAPRPGG